MAGSDPLMSFQWPFLLASLLLIPLGLLLMRRIERGRRARVAALAGLGGPAGVRVAGERSRQARAVEAVAALLVLAASVLLCIALARPQASVTLPRSEGTLILTFDVSGSMAATDVAPDRLEQARSVARAFADAQPDGVVVGVVAFSDGGLTIQVPTADSRLVDRAIGRLIPSLGTSLGDGMLAALEAIAEVESEVPASWYSNRSPDPAAATPDPAPAVTPGSHDSAALVVLSDGENTTDPGPLEIALIAAERGIRVHTVGVGTEAGITLDLDGFRVHTRLEAAALREVARMTGGVYHPAADADLMVADAYGQLGRRINLHEEWFEITALVAGLGLALLAAGGVLSLVGRGRLP